MTADQIANAVQSLLDWLWTPIPGSEYPWAAVVLLVIATVAGAVAVRPGASADDVGEHAGDARAGGA